MIFPARQHPFHVAKPTKTSFQDEGIHIIDLSAKSSDLNPIEDLWKQMVRVVYDNRRCFDNVVDLKVEALRVMYAF